MTQGAVQTGARRPGVWTVTALFLGAIAFFKGFRFPGRWAATQAMLDYSQGFAKRGLFGATVARWLHFGRYTHYSFVSYALLFLLIALLVLFTRSSGVGAKLGSGEVVALFFASYALTYLAHLVGYLDILLAIFTVGLLMIRNTRLRFALALPATIVALLIHEMFFLVFLPVLLFSFLLDAQTTENFTKRGRYHLMAGALAIVSLATTLRMALLRPLNVAQVNAMKAEVEKRVDFDIRGDVFDVMTRSFHDNVWKMAWVWGHDLGWKFLFLICAFIFSLTIILLLRTVLKVSRALTLPKPLVLAAIVASLAPLLMYVLAWDEGRWDTLVCLDSYLVLLLLVRVLPGRLPLFSQRFRYAVVLSIAISMASGEGLMDHLQPNTFPFFGDLSTAIQSIQQDGWAPPDQ